MSFATDFPLATIYTAVGEAVPLYRCKASQIASGGAPPKLVIGVMELNEGTLTDGEVAVDTIVPTFEARQVDLDALGVAPDTWSLLFNGVRYDVTQYRRLDAGIGILHLRKL